ncbi:MAG: ATP-binding protein [Desulfonatronovibrio sp.]
MRIHDVITIHLPADTRLVSAAVAALREYSAGIGFGEPDISRISLALEEAFCYAVSMGYGTDRDTVRVILGRTALGLRMTLTSRGIPLDEEALPRYDPKRLHLDGDMTGIHSHLVRSTVDKAVFSILKGNRRKIILFKNLPPAKDHSPAEQSCPIPEKSKPTTTLCLAGPGDAEGIARLALRSHGSLLFNVDIYYPDRVREMLEQGEMHSMVVKTPQGEILGHGALVAEAAGALVEEITFGMVDKRLRGQNCSNELADALLADARERGLHGVFALAVCNHDLSQRSVLRAGFGECALMMAASPPSKSWSRAQEQSRVKLEPSRIANLVLIRFLQKTRAVPLFPPRNHQDMINRIHQHLGLPETSQGLQSGLKCQESRKAGDPGLGGLQAGQVRLRVETDIREGWAWIVVLKYGLDAVVQVEEQLRRLCSQNMPVIYMMLPLEAPATAAITKPLEDKGFFFSGITFCPEGREYLALQYVSADPGFDRVQVHSPFARELLNYVRDCSLSQS